MNIHLLEDKLLYFTIYSREELLFKICSKNNNTLIQNTN